MNYISWKPRERVGGRTKTIEINVGYISWWSRRCRRCRERTHRTTVCRSYLIRSKSVCVCVAKVNIFMKFRRPLAPSPPPRPKVPRLSKNF